METNSFSTNKIVSILIAIVVTACVLIPICNEFGNSGGSDNPSPLADGDTTRMNLIPNDEWGSMGKRDNPIRFNLNDFNTNEVLFILDDGDTWGIWCIDGDAKLYGISDSDEEGIVTFSGADYPYFVIYFDDHDSVWKCFAEDDEEYINEDIGTYGLTGRDYQGNVYAYDMDGESVVSVNVDNPDNPVFTIQGNGGSNGGNSNGNSGIAGTLITIIPVFVLLAILGSIAYIFVNRNEIQ